MPEPIIKMKCPDDECKADLKKFKEDTKDGIDKIEEVLGTKLSKNTLRIACLGILGVIVTIVLYGMSSYAILKEQVITSKADIYHVGLRLDRTQLTLEKIRDQQIIIKEDIIREIKRNNDIRN